MKRPLKYFLLILVTIVILCVQEHSSIYNTSVELQEQAVELAQTVNKPVPPNSFTQDGCTLFPNVLPGHDFRDACLTHDFIYWLGGTESQRHAADVALKDAISHTGPMGPIFAPIMYAGVRTFGDTWLSKRLNANWGYGWNQ